MNNPKDFRIGNLVKLPIYYDESESCHALTGLDDEHPYVKCITMDYLEWDEIKPLPLTEIWFLRLGFQKSDGYYMIANTGFYFGISLDGKAMFMFEEENTCPSRIEYVHQLQNLHRYFTGIELEISCQ